MRIFVAIYIIALCIAMLATDSGAQGPWAFQGRWIYSVPDPLPLAGGGALYGATEADLLANGGRAVTAQEIADKAAADQAAQEEAAAAASLPLVCHNGVAVVVDTHHIKLVPVLEDGVVLPVQISECDIEAGKASAMEASAVTAYKTGKAQAKAETQALKDAGKNAKLKDAERIALLEQRLGVLENKLFGVEK